MSTQVSSWDYSASSGVSSELPEQVDREPLIQMALQALMRSNENVVERFIELAEEQPEVAKRILMSSISRLVNLHVVHSLNAELIRRAEWMFHNSTDKLE